VRRFSRAGIAGILGCEAVGAGQSPTFCASGYMPINVSNVVRTLELLMRVGLEHKPVNVSVVPEEHMPMMHAASSPLLS
jgi:hypothetical protein